MNSFELICDRFEAELRSGNKPDFAAYLLDCVPEDRPRLLSELSALETFYRKQAGAGPEFDETIDSAGTRTTTPDDLRRVGDYEILCKLAEGGMGVVYKARQLGLNRVVALKMIRFGAAAGSDELIRFQREAEAVARLQHPNIVQIFEIGLHQEQPYFSMELIEGGSLSSRLNGTPWTAERAAALVIELARGAEFAHQKGILHRDLKPGNVLLAEHVSPAIPKITDFGLAKHIDAAGQQLTLVEAVVGTPSYMSPEQASGSGTELGPATDIYSLGAILYELLTGRPPFKGATVLETLEQVRRQDPAPPRRLNSAIPRDLETICLKSLAKEPRRRYVSAGEFADDLQHFVRGEPIRARPVGRLEQAWLWCKREPWVAGLSAAAAALLVVGSVVSTAFGLSARHQADLALHSAAEAKAAQVEEENARQDAERRRIEAEKSREEAERRRIEAEEAQKRAEDVREYLVKLFRSPDPDFNGEKLTVVQLLEAALPRLEIDFNADPRSKVTLLDAIGQTFTGLGLGHRAITVNRQAYDLSLAEFGADDDATRRAQHNLGVALYSAGEYAEALPHLERAVELTERLLGRDNTQTLDTLNNLAVTYSGLNKREQALPLLEEVYVRRGSLQGDNHPEAMRAANNLAAAYTHAGRLPEALKVIEQTLERQRRVLPADHPEVATTLQNLAAGYERQGEYKRALALQEQCLPILQKRLPADHPKLLGFTRELAITYVRSGQEKKGWDLLEEALVRFRATNPGHPLALKVMVDVGTRYLDAKNPQRARELYEEALPAMREKLGNRDPNTQVCIYNLAGTYRDLKLPELAIPLYEESLAERKGSLGLGHQQTLLALAHLAEQYGATKQYAQVIRLQEELLAYRRAELRAEHPLSIATLADLASARRSNKELEQSAELYAEARRLSLAVHGPDHEETLKITTRLGDVFGDLKQDEQTVPLYEEVVKRGKSNPKFNAVTYYATMNNLGLCYERLKRSNEALSLYEQAYPKQKELEGPSNTHTQNCGMNLLRAYAAQKLWAKVTPLALELAEPLRSQPDSGERLMELLGILVESYRQTSQFQLTLPVLHERLELRRQLSGADHLFSLVAIQNLAYGYHQAGRLAEAIPWYEQALPKFQALQGHDSPNALICQHHLAQAQLQTNAAAAAVPALEFVLAARLKKEGVNGPETLVTMIDLAFGYESIGEWAKSLAQHQAVLDQMLTKVAADNWLVHRYKISLGMARLGLKEVKEAEPLLASFESLEKQAATLSLYNRRYLTRAAARIAELYIAADLPDKAAIWKETASRLEKQAQ